MWKQSKLLYNRCASQKSKVLSRNHKTAEVITKLTNTTSENPEHVLPKEARVVVCGGGVMGGAVAYYLSLLGWGPETVLVESGRCESFFSLNIFLLNKKISWEKINIYFYNFSHM